MLRIWKSLAEEEVRNKDLKKAFHDKCSQFVNLCTELDTLKVSIAEKESESKNFKDKHASEIEQIKLYYNVKIEKILKQKEEKDNIVDEKIKKLSNENNTLRLSLAEKESKIKTNDDKYIAEKEKIKLNFNKNKEFFLKQKENNDNLKIKVEN